MAEAISRPLAVKTSIAEASTTILDDSRVLKGNVPQCDDWLSAWAESIEKILSASNADCLRKNKSNKSNPDL